MVATDASNQKRNVIIRPIVTESDGKATEKTEKPLNSCMARPVISLLKKLRLVSEHFMLKVSTLESKNSEQSFFMFVLFRHPKSLSPLS